jgi:SecD/SecF fusion protein
MRNKGAIKLLAITLALVSLYQLSFTYVTRKIENRAAEYAMDENGIIDPAKEFAFLDSIATEVVYNFLGIRKFTFKETKEREINLGLDLRGGMNVTLEVSSEEIIRALSNYNTDTTFVRAIAMARETQLSSSEDFITLFGRAFETLDPNGRLAAIFTTIEMRDKVSFNSTNAEVLAVLRTETESAINNSFNILRSRIDRFGVTQPNIQKLETHGRILVELPGIKEPERVRKLLQGTANLEFWETYENSEVYPFLLEANSKIKELEEAERALIRDVEETPSEAPVVEMEAEEPAEVDPLLELIDQQDTTDLGSDMTPERLAIDFPLFNVLTPNTSMEGQLIPGSVIGLAQSRDTAKVNRYLNMPQVRQLFPRDMKFFWGNKPPRYDETENLYELHAIKVTSRDGRPALDGDVITDARRDFGQTQASAEVTMAMNAEGSKIWARLTRDNVGRAIAIVLDNYVYSAPRVNQEITGGRSQITGDFSINEADDLANILKSGKLPAPARIISEAIVGPSLGQEAIDSGLSSFLIAFVIVLLYMMFYYSRKAGLVADIALVVNVFFIMGVLASLGAVLTLPGIAGIVLTIGMSVDANVLIYERIREELKGGKGLKLAVSDGYKNAYSAIIDANVTTLLIGIILILLGTGPIKGFATTLVIGVCTSLFSAIFITRLIFTWFLDRNKTISFATKLTQDAFSKVHIKFIEKRKISYVISGILLTIAIVSLFSRGLSQGIDFTGGRTYIVRFEQPISTIEIQNLLRDDFGEPPSVITFGGENQVRISTNFRINETDTEVDEELELLLYENLKPLLSEDVDLEKFMSDYRQQSQKVGPAIAHDIKVEAVWAILVALLMMFLYIFFRFKNWQFGLGATAALVHDALIVLGVFSLFHGIMPFSLEIDQAFIAAILTVVGYSINDTVIVFDRIREYFQLYPKRERVDIYDLALNSTLGRTFSTSLSTIFVLLAIFIFGGEVIRGFIFAMLLGIVVGTYSSLFIATPVVFDAIGRKKAKESVPDKKK